MTRGLTTHRGGWLGDDVGVWLCMVMEFLLKTRFSGATPLCGSKRCLMTKRFVCFFVIAEVGGACKSKEGLFF
jgi:hypothetical protein